MLHSPTLLFKGVPGTGSTTVLPVPGALSGSWHPHEITKLFEDTLQLFCNLTTELMEGLEICCECLNKDV